MHGMIADMKIATQGVAGSFHHQATNELFEGQDYQIIDAATFRDVFQMVKDGTADFGVVAVENSLHGSINPVYRLLASKKLQVCGERRLHISLCLIGHSTMTIQSVNSSGVEVLSQREALSQCEQWFIDNIENATVKEMNDTAEAVSFVMNDTSKQKVAVGSAEAARLYGGTIIAEPINDELQNYTRFLCITKPSPQPKDADRTSIIISGGLDRPGLLHDALGAFAKKGINLSKLDSHPLPGKERSYAMYIDFEAPLEDSTTKSVLEELKKQGWNVQVLGSYKSHKH